LLGWQVEDGPVADAVQIHLVEDAIEEVGALLHALGYRIDGSDHPLAIFPLDDDDHIVVVVEGIDELLPALLARLIRAQEIVALRVVGELIVSDLDGRSGKSGSREENEPRMARNPRNESGDGSCEEVRSAFRAHNSPSAANTATPGSHIGEPPPPFKSKLAKQRGGKNQRS
jgi:hypothetical protein